MQRWHQVGIRVGWLGEPGDPHGAVQVGVAPLVDVQLDPAPDMVLLPLGREVAAFADGRGFEFHCTGIQYRSLAGVHDGQW